MSPRRALVLSGGVAYGAYEAGVILGLAEAGKLDQYDVICGASIGTLNGALLATGQAAGGKASPLRALWSNIAQRDVMRAKHQYAAVLNPSSGILTRGYEAVKFLYSAIAGNETGFVDSGPAHDAVQQTIMEGDGITAKPFIRPLLWSATNVSVGCSQGFIREAATSQLKSSDGSIRDLPTISDLTQVANGRSVVLEVPDTQLVETLRASTAMPGVFDPVQLAAPLGPFVDGGVLNNSPFNLARYAKATDIDVVFLSSPGNTFFSYGNAKEILLSCFYAMQQRILDDSILFAMLESDPQALDAMRKTFAKATGQFGGHAPPTIRDFVLAKAGSDPVPPVAVNWIAPSAGLQGHLTGFDDQPSIDANLELGYHDALTNGFLPLNKPTESCPGGGP